MKTSNQTLDALTQKFTGYLKEIKRRPGTIEKYTEVWRRVGIFMKSHKIRFYNKNVEQQYLQYLYGNYNYSALTKYKKDIVNCVEVLIEFQEAGKIAMGPRKVPLRTFEGVIGVTIENYISHKKRIYQLCDSTLHNYRFYLNGFFQFLKQNAIHSIDQIRPDWILLFVSSCHDRTMATRHIEILIIKGYLRYLYHEHLVPSDYSEVIPKDNYKAQAHLPSTFTRQEIHTLLTSIDRGNSKGKRDYAMLLLATKLGLRSSDITGLKFEHILWDQHIISFQQRKTRKNIKVPLLPEVGNAIIDYLKNGRPVSDENYCFLQIQSPYKPIDKGSVGNIVKFHLNQAGINCKNRKHGPHALRHSLAGSLLQDKIPVPVISEVLGHSDSETTMYYLRIDSTSLKQCALNVPLVCSSFYNQKNMRHE